jgi:hypothetical protein
MLPAPPLPDDDTLTARREGDEVILLVKGATSPHKLSGALLGYLREDDVRRIVARAIGAGAVNQAAKGCAIARMLAKQESPTARGRLKLWEILASWALSSASAWVLSPRTSA